MSSGSTSYGVRASSGPQFVKHELEKFRSIASLIVRMIGYGSSLPAQILAVLMQYCMFIPPFINFGWQ